MADAKEAAVPLVTKQRAPLHAAEVIFYPSAFLIAVVAFWIWYFLR